MFKNPCNKTIGYLELNIFFENKKGKKYKESANF